MSYWATQADSTEPTEYGYRAGLRGTSYLPELAYRRSEDWLAFWSGWHRGKAARMILERERKVA